MFRTLRWSAALALAAVLCLTGAAALTPDGYPLMSGMDVSVWQGSIDFAAAAEDGIEVVYIRAGYGRAEDSRFKENYTGAKEAGLRVGFYHYLTARTEEEARIQAGLFAQRIQDLDYDCRPAMDFESFGDLSREETNAVALAFLVELEELTGQIPMVYSDAYNANEVFDQSVARWPLWAAEYGPSEPVITAHWLSWAGFQHSSTGRVAGIEGNVDLDWFTWRVVLDSCHGEAPEPPAPPEPERTYIVRAGDTLWGISRRYGVSLDELIRINQVPNPNLIFPGEVLRLPN